MPLFATLFMGVYTWSGHIGYENGTILNFIQIESEIPFYPWSIWIYIVLYPIYIVWALMSYEDEIQMNKTLYSFFILGFISCCIFIIYPISYPRHLYPLPSSNDITNVLFQMTRSIDKPSNCLPSLHVGLCYLFAYGFWKENKIKFNISIFFSSLIAISTLTTKQHYIVDILTSLILSTAIYYIIHTKTRITQTSDI